MTGWHLSRLASVTAMALLIGVGSSAPLVEAGQLGKEISQEEPDAATWFRQKAEQGDATAMNYLGLFYQNGQGVPQDDSKAYLWFHLAATYATIASTFPASTRDELIRLRDVSAERLTPDQRADAQHRAREFFEAHPPQ